VYHVELRQFPHNLCRFNLTEEELRLTVLEPWARDQWIEMGERKWSPQQAKITVLKGPELAVNQLTMGRGWRAAQRQSEDVTDGLLAAVRQSAGVSGPAPSIAPSKRGGGFAWRGPAADVPPPSGSSVSAVNDHQARGSDSAADSLGLELLSLMGGEPIAPWRAWELASLRYPASAASECLAMAERAIGSLLRSRLVALFVLDSEGAEQQRDAEGARETLREIESWSGEREPARVWIRRV
jgi:hypothetical protein